jgi:tetratricopeptide (TPR) repeat protein
MKSGKGVSTCAISVVAMALVMTSSAARAQTAPDDPALQTSPIGTLQLTPDVASQLEQAMGTQNFVAAEKILLAEIEHDPRSSRAAHLLSYAGTIYFRNHDYVNAAIAWKKSEAIAPLDSSVRFSLAMTYIRLSHSDWARPVLESLAGQNGKEALYPYWLGRIDYDGHQYNEAIRHFQHAVELNPQMARAYDNLGLCYYYQNQNELALTSYEKAIQLDRGSMHPSPWPYLNIAVTQQFLNRLPQAEKNLQEALRLDPAFAKAHFQLGTVLEDLGRPLDALKELREAARLDPTYAEPHMAMARVMHKLGQELPAREEVQTYLRLHPHSTP